MTEFSFTAFYKNGNIMTLSDDLSYDDIPRDGLAAFTVSIGKSQLFTIHLEEGQKLIYRKRDIVQAGKKIEESPEPIIYMIGWRQRVEGKDVQSITYICDWIGRGFQIHQAGKFNDKHPWFYSPSLRESEVFKGEKYFDTKEQIEKVK